MEIIQSFIYSVARVRLSLYEQRILIKVIEHAQVILKGKLVKNCLFRMEHDLENVKIEIPVRYILSDGSKHYDAVKDAARSLQGRTFEYYDSEAKAWYTSPIIYNVAYVQGSGLISFYVSKMLFDVALDFSKGFCKYDLETAINLPSPYACRMYALTNSQTRPINYTISDLKRMFGVEKKYTQTRDFILKVIEPAKKALDAAECNSFTYSRVKDGNKVIALCIAPLRRKTQDEKELASKVSVNRLITNEIAIVLISYMGFTTKELAAHKVLLHKFCQMPYAQDQIYNIERRYRKKKKSKGYVIAAIRDEVAQWEALQAK